MNNAKLLEMNRWLAALAADVIFTHVPGIAGAGTRRERHADEPDEPQSWRAAPRAAVLTDSWPTIEPLIDTLPEPQRQVFRLHLVEGLSYREVAERLTVPLGTVHSRIARGKRRIRAGAAERILPPAASRPLVRRPPPGPTARPTAAIDGPHSCPVRASNFAPPSTRPMIEAVARGGDLSNRPGWEAP